VPEALEVGDRREIGRGNRMKAGARRRWGRHCGRVLRWCMRLLVVRPWGTPGVWSRCRGGRGVFAF
jgi:hypothetical protein